MEKYLSKFNLTEKQKNQFKDYYKFLIEYNEKVNLTAITDESEVYIKHFYDSLLSLDYIPNGASVLDLGSGAGFPGVPLKIANDTIHLTLLDALNKRVEFLKQLTNLLDIECECVHARAEEFVKLHRESFDVVTARAVSPLNTLAEYALPLVKVGGIFIAYKGSNVNDELSSSKNAIKILGGEIIDVKNFELLENLGSRSIIIIKKIRNTPNKFPREKNLAKINPIK